MQYHYSNVYLSLNILIIQLGPRTHPLGGPVQETSSTSKEAKQIDSSEVKGNYNDIISVPI